MPPPAREGWPTSATSSLNGDGMWLHFTLATPLVLATNTTYGFDLTSVGNNNVFFEWLGNATNIFSSGAAYKGSTAGTPDNTLNTLVGDRVFLVQLTPLAHPLLTARMISGNQVQISWPATNVRLLFAIHHESVRAVDLFGPGRFQLERHELRHGCRPATAMFYRLQYRAAACN